MNDVSELHELLRFALISESNLTPRRATVLASRFATLKEFLTVKAEALREIQSVTGKKILFLAEGQVKAVKALQASGVLSAKRDTSENFLVLIARDFVRKQTKMLDSLTLDRMSPNPLLIRCLNLKTSREVVELNVYMFATRSIVTSMGFFVEKLLLTSSSTVSRAGDPWDIVKTDKNQRRHWIQVKSGPNDMDADQIRHWAGLIANKVTKRDQAYIGTTYGKRQGGSVTMGLFKTYLPDWKQRTLIGKELWDFISDDPHYHEKLFPLLAEAASQMLGAQSIEQRIQKRIEQITREFSLRYGSSRTAVEKYLADIF
jgi:type II restriction endonuclease EcoO109I-like protein